MSLSLFAQGNSSAFATKKDGEFVLRGQFNFPAQKHFEAKNRVRVILCLLHSNSVVHGTINDQKDESTSGRITPA